MQVGPYYPQDSYLYSTADQLVKDFEEEIGKPLPKHKVVCPECRGEGTRTNRSIDGNGLSQDMMDDPDFMHDYMSGAYDVRCDECHGRNVVEEVDEEALDPETLAAWHAFLKDYHDGLAEHLGEMRMGA